MQAEEFAYATYRRIIAQVLQHKTKSTWVMRKSCQNQRLNGSWRLLIHFPSTSLCNHLVECYYNGYNGLLSLIKYKLHYAEYKHPLALKPNRNTVLNSFYFSFSHQNSASLLTFIEHTLKLTNIMTIKTNHVKSF